MKYQESIKESTGIPNVKIGYNRVFGYYIEVSKSHVSSVPEDFICKQTLTNAQRYFTEELKEYENKILCAKENILQIEKGVVLYENKDNQKLKAFKLERDHNQWNTIINRCFKIMGMTTLPKTCKGSTWCPCRSIER